MMTIDLSRSDVQTLIHALGMYITATHGVTLTQGLLYTPDERTAYGLAAAQAQRLRERMTEILKENEQQ